MPRMTCDVAAGAIAAESRAAAMSIRGKRLEARRRALLSFLPDCESSLMCGAHGGQAEPLEESLGPPGSFLGTLQRRRILGKWWRNTRPEARACVTGAPAVGTP